jgi:hypothetical protein
MFRDLLFRKKQCVFIAFDLLFLNGKDLRTGPFLGRLCAPSLHLNFDFWQECDQFVYQGVSGCAISGGPKPAAKKMLQKHTLSDFLAAMQSPA